MPRSSPLPPPPVAGTRAGTGGGRPTGDAPGPGGPTSWMSATARTRPDAVLGYLGAWENGRRKTGTGSASPKKVREPWHTPAAGKAAARSAAPESWVLTSAQHSGGCAGGVGLRTSQGACLTVAGGPRRCPTYFQKAGVSCPQSPYHRHASDGSHTHK